MLTQEGPAWLEMETPTFFLSSISATSAPDVHVKAVACWTDPSTFPSPDVPDCPLNPYTGSEINASVRLLSVVSQSAGVAPRLRTFAVPRGHRSRLSSGLFDIRKGSGGRTKRLGSDETAAGKGSDAAESGGKIVCDTIR